MKNKFRTKRAGAIIACLWLIFTGSAIAATIDLKIIPNIATVESGSGLLHASVILKSDADVWATGIQASLGNQDNKDSGFNTAIFQNVALSSAVNSYAWNGLNIGPQYNGNGTISCSKFVLSDKEGQPPTGQGIKNSGTSDLFLYTLQLIPFDELSVGAQGQETDIKLDTMVTEVPPGNNSISYFEGGKYIAAPGTHANAKVTIMPATPPLGFKGPSNVIDNETGNSLTIQWETNGTTDLTPPVIYDLYYNEGSSFNNPDNESKSIRKDLGGTSATISGPALKDKFTYYFRMRAKDAAVGNNKEKLGAHKTTYTDTENEYMKSGAPHDYKAPGEVANTSVAAANNKITINYTTPGDADFAGVMVLKNTANPDLPTLKTPSYYKTQGQPNKDGDIYGIGDALGNGWEIIDYELKSISSSHQFAEQGLENGKSYYYCIFTFDLADESQQGRNYSHGTVIKAVPGEKPGIAENLEGLTQGEGEILLRWDTPKWETEKAKYGGALILFNTNKGNEDKWSKIPDNPNDNPGYAFKIDAPYDVDLEPQTNSLLLKSLDPALVYYYKVVAYNRVTAENKGNELYANAVNVAAAPGKPGSGGAGTVSGFQIKSLNIGENPFLDLEWAGALTGGLVYELYKSTDPKSFTGNPIASGAGLTGYKYNIQPNESEVYFRVKISGENSPWAPETVGAKKFNLQKSSTGINSITIPFNQYPYNGYTADIMKDEINNQKNKKIVEYIAGWDEATQKEYARIYSGDVAIDIGDKGNFSINPWVGYQISVSENYDNWWMHGEVSGD